MSGHREDQNALKQQLEPLDNLTRKFINKKQIFTRATLQQLK